MWGGTTQRRAALPPDSHEQHVSHTLGFARLGDSTLQAKSTAVCQQPCVRADAASRTSITACVTYSTYPILFAHPGKAIAVVNGIG